MYIHEHVHSHHNIIIAQKLLKSLLHSSLNGLENMSNVHVHVCIIHVTYIDVQMYVPASDRTLGQLFSTCVVQPATKPVPHWLPTGHSASGNSHNPPDTPQLQALVEGGCVATELQPRTVYDSQKIHLHQYLLHYKIILS